MNLNRSNPSSSANGDPEKMPARDLGLEMLAEVLSGQRVVHHHTHRHDDILTVLRLQKEFGFRAVLHHVSEAWKVVDEITAAKVPCSIIVLDSPGGKIEARDIDWKNGAVLERAGVLTGFHTDDSVTEKRPAPSSSGNRSRLTTGNPGNPSRYECFGATTSSTHRNATASTMRCPTWRKWNGWPRLFRSRKKSSRKAADFIVSTREDNPPVMEHGAP